MKIIKFTALAMSVLMLALALASCGGSSKKTILVVSFVGMAGSAVTAVTAPDNQLTFALDCQRLTCGVDPAVDSQLLARRNRQDDVVVDGDAAIDRHIVVDGGILIPGAGVVV